MSKQIWIAVIAIIIIIAGVWYFQTPRPATGESVVINAVLPMTGGLARYGELEKNGLELAKDEINQNGGIGGHPVEIVYEDSQSTSPGAISAWQKVSLGKKPSLVITAGSSICQTLSPLANQSQVVLMSTDCAVAGYSSPDDYTFRILSSNAEESKQMADFLKNRGVMKVAILQVANDYGDSLFKSFKIDYANLGGEILAHESYLGTSHDFKTELTKVTANKDIQALYIMSYAPDAEIILKQIKELQINLPIYAAEPFENAQLLTNSPKEAEGVIYPRPFVGGKVGESFNNAYRIKYQKEGEITPARTYDLLQVVATVGNKCGLPLTADCLKDGLYQVKNFPGTAGQISFDSNGDVHLPYVLKTVKNGQFVKLEE